MKSVPRTRLIIMRQGRGSEATEAVFCLQAKKPLPSGSYERRVPKKKKKQQQSIFCTRDVCLFVCLFVCVIQHRNWPLTSTILNAHGTNASPDGLCTRTHVRLDRVSNDGYKSCRGLRIYSQALLWNSASCRRVRALRSLSDLSLSLCPLMLSLQA